MNHIGLGTLRGRFTHKNLMKNTFCVFLFSNFERLHCKQKSSGQIDRKNKRTKKKAFMRKKKNQKTCIRMP